VIPYDAVFEGMLALARTFNRKDMDAHCRLDDPLGEAGPDETAAFVAELCERSPAHVEALGAEVFGDLLSYVMGTGAQLWHEVAEASPSAAEDAVAGEPAADEAARPAQDEAAEDEAEETDDGAAETGEGHDA